VHMLYEYINAKIRTHEGLLDSFSSYIGVK
jgi:hypothetical protein